MLRLDVPGAVAMLALASGAFGLGMRPRARGRLAVHAASGALAAALFVLRVATWLEVVAVQALALGAVALLPAWRGEARDARRHAREALALLGAASSIPVLFACVAAAAGTWGVFAGELALALPRHPWSALAVATLVTLAVVLAADGLSTERPRARLLVALGTAAAGVVLAVRLVWIVGMARLPGETFWPEAPFLVNQLKLEAHVPLYGPPARLDSYTYSPLLDLVQHALLAPLGRALSLHAHRALVVADQVLAAALLLWALPPRARSAWTALAVCAATFANLLAATVHPDHPLLLCFAAAVALLVAEERMPRALWWTLLVLVTPVATAFKLSGAGIGVGLGLSLVLERRWRAVLALAGSAAITAGIAPLFDATLGSFSFYAVRVQASHPIEWSRLFALPGAPVALAVYAALALHVALRRTVRASVDVRRLLLLTAAVAVASMPAYAKYAGRDNNLSLLLLGAVLFIVMRAADAAARAPHPALAPTLALLAVVVFRAPAPPPSRADRELAERDFARVVAQVRADDSEGAKTLLLVQTAPWIAAGHREVPPDRLHSAIELAFGGYPDAERLPAHIADGRYASVVVSGSQLRLGDDPVGRFDARLRAALDGYEVVYPEGAPSIDATEGLIILRRRSARAAP